MLKKESKFGYGQQITFKSGPKSINLIPHTIQLSLDPRINPNILQINPLTIQNSLFHIYISSKVPLLAVISRSVFYWH